MIKRYEKYRPSGIEWIGEIPVHWKVKKLKYIGDSIIGITYSPDDITIDDTGILVLRASNIQNGMLSFADSVYVQKEIKPKHFTKSGDVLLCARSGSPHLVGKAAYINDKYAGLTFGAFMTVVRSDSGKFLYYFFNSDIFRSQIGVFITSTINQLTADTLDNLFIAYPSQLIEQTDIANYLDKKTAEIDDFIAKKQKLIKLLGEERTAIINQLISGDGKKYRKIRLKYLVTKVGSGITPTGGATVYLQEGIPLLRSQNIYSDGLALDDLAFISEEIDQQMSNSRIQEGDVLLNITGASIGRCCFVPVGFGRGNVNQHVCIIRPIQTIIKTEYLHSFLISDLGQTLIDIHQNGANREGLNFQQIKSFEIPLPTINEQEELLHHIRTDTKKVDDIISKIEKEIDIMQEYRTALISEVVTGKIKVI